MTKRTTQAKAILFDRRKRDDMASLETVHLDLAELLEIQNTIERAIRQKLGPNSKLMSLLHLKIDIQTQAEKRIAFFKELGKLTPEQQAELVREERIHEILEKAKAST